MGSRGRGMRAPGPSASSGRLGGAPILWGPRRKLLQPGRLQPEATDRVGPPAGRRGLTPGCALASEHLPWPPGAPHMRGQDAMAPHSGGQTHCHSRWADSAGPISQTSRGTHSPGRRGTRKAWGASALCGG